MIPDPPIFAPQILAQVVKLLKAEPTVKLLEILRSRIVELSMMDDDAIAGPAGLAHVHRLASEAGILGFRRLSTLCAILDDGPGHRSSEVMSWAQAELHPTLERSHEEVLRQLQDLPNGEHHGLAS